MEQTSFGVIWISGPKYVSG